METLEWMVHADRLQDKQTNKTSRQTSAENLTDSQTDKSTDGGNVVWITSSNIFTTVAAICSPGHGVI